jgi:outer membrane lipoprotein-sorting protein
MARLVCGALSLGTLLLWLAGCHSIPNPWQELPPPPTPLSSAAPVWEHLAVRRQALNNLKGLAQVRLRGSVRDATLDDAVVVLQDFEAIRLEGIGPVGQPLFLLIADSHQLSFYDPQEGRLLTGAASAENLLRLFGIALTPMTLQYVLMGDVPLATLPTVGAFTYRRRENLYLWQGQAPSQPQAYRIWFEPYDLHPVRFEMEDAGGQLVLQVWYEEFQRFNGFMMPYRITLVQPTVGRRVVWQYKDAQLNAGVAPALFRMRVPVGTTRVAIEDLPKPEGGALPSIW